MLTVMLTACGGGDKKDTNPSASPAPVDGEHPAEAVGLWKLDHASKDGTTLTESEIGKFEMELKADGTGSISLDNKDDNDPGKTGDITWAIIKEKLIIKDSSYSDEAEFDGKTISFPDYQKTGIQAVFTK